MDKENQNLIKLVSDTQNGVDGAFEALYHESFKHAYCTASLLLKNEHDIEDVLQNSYMYVAKYIKDLKNPESFNNWLGVIVKHECQKYIAKQKRIGDIFAAVKEDKEFDLIESASLPDGYIEKNETRDKIRRIVDSLPEDKRACVVLFYYEQHSLTEISEMLGVPEGTVMSRLFYARKKLEKEFKKLQRKDESLLGVSIIPLIVSLFAYQAKTIVIPSAVENGIIAAVSTQTATASAVSASSAAAGTVPAGVSAAGAAGTAVAAKITAVAVAASVAVGGGVATVSYIKNENKEVTAQAISATSTEEHATAAVAVFEETSAVFTEISTSAAVTETSSKAATTTQITKATKTETTRMPDNQTTEATTTSTKTTTAKVTTTKETTSRETSTQRETTTQKITTTAVQTTAAADIFSVSNGVLNEYTGNGGNVSIPSTVGSSAVTAIGTGAFAGNTDIASVSLPSSVTRIGMEAFSDCTNLKSISLPPSLESIGIAAFYGCSSLTSVTIPSGTKTISDEAFSYCTSLSSITVPDSVTSISEDAFYGSENVTIRCTEGSAAHDYAVENSINYELI